MGTLAVVRIRAFTKTSVTLNNIYYYTFLLTSEATNRATFPSVCSRLLKARQSIQITCTLPPRTQPLTSLLVGTTPLLPVLTMENIKIHFHPKLPSCSLGLFIWCHISISSIVGRSQPAQFQVRSHISTTASSALHHHSNVAAAAE